LYRNLCIRKEGKRSVAVDEYLGKFSVLLCYYSEREKKKSLFEGRSPFPIREKKKKPAQSYEFGVGGVTGCGSTRKEERPPTIERNEVKKKWGGGNT